MTGHRQAGQPESEYEGNIGRAEKSTEGLSGKAEKSGSSARIFEATQKPGFYDVEEIGRLMT